MVPKPKVRRFAPRLSCGAATRSLLFLALTLALSGPALADNWTGAGQNPATQIRDWNWGGPIFNWIPGPLPLPNAVNYFGPIGEGTINIIQPESTGGLVFFDFSYSNLAPGMPGALLKMSMNPSGINTGEGVRDTYGVDYFTAGPRISVDMSFSTLNVMLGQAPGMGDDSALILSGQLIADTPIPTLNYTGQGNNSSLWITSNNTWANGGNVTISSPGAMPTYGTHALRLVDTARLNGATVTLNDVQCAFGLHDNTLAGMANSYNNRVVTNNGNIFTDRSYQLNDLDSTINGIQRLPVVQTVDMFLTGYSGANFGTPGSFGRTNNGFSLLVDVLQIIPSEVNGIGVHNGNLTEQRGGSRYISGANRLQEAHNYVSVDDLQLPQGPTFGKIGTGVLWINELNATTPPGFRDVWFCSPTISAGVMRLGSIFSGNHTMAVGQQFFLTADSALGFGYSQPVNLSIIPQVPFPITPGGGVPGQSGAVNLDMWGYTVPQINTNIGPIPAPNYLRVASSMGGDASFDPQPLPTKHASTTAQIVPFVTPPPSGDIEGVYYLGGGGGTLRIDSVLTDWTYLGQPIPCWLEMGTTGTLLPGRIALANNNEYTGRTDIRAGTLQLMAPNAIPRMSVPILGTYNNQIFNGLYDYQLPNNTPYTWKGPGMLLLDPGQNQDWNLAFYGLLNKLQLDNGVIGWTGNVNIPQLPGTFVNNPLNPFVSNLTGGLQIVNILGLGGEYSAGTMFMQFGVADNMLQDGTIVPVLLYKAGKNSVLDMRQIPGGRSTYTGGTVIAGGTILLDDPAQLNAGEMNEGGGPIAILNGGRLRVAAPPKLPPYDLFLNVPIKINTDGTPDLVKNCGSVVEVDANVNLIMMRPFDFSWNPTAYLEKDGLGTLRYNAMPGGAIPANAWGLKLTQGLVELNQLPVQNNADSGPVIFNNGNLRVMQVVMGVQDTNPAYGFRNIVSMKGTTSTVTVDDNAMFRTHGIVPSELLGTVHFKANDLDGDTTNHVVHLSRNMAPAIGGSVLPAMTRGNGAMTFEGVTVYMSGGGGGMGSGPLNVLPIEAGFVLQLSDGATFNASRQNNVMGEVNFNNLTPSDPNKWVRIDGEEAGPVPLGTLPYNFALTPDVWAIAGTGLTTWAGTTEKVGPGRVVIARSQGAPVLINANAILRISGGTFEAAGDADPFTDTVSGFSMSIVNDSTNHGLLISQGIKTVNTITGVGNTIVTGSGTVLNATSIAQNSLTIGGPSPLPVPEPNTWAMLIIVAITGIAFLGKRIK